MAVQGYDAGAMATEAQEAFENIKEVLERVNNDIRAVNVEMFNEFKRQLIQRINNLDRHSALLGALPFPLEHRHDAPEVAVPLVRREMRVATKQESSPGKPPDYFLEQKEYENILAVLADMSRVLEFNPSVFHKLDEESLRWLLLVPLNGHYKGQATGETFNAAGKTDIIIKHDSKNIFIAECKKWTGGAALTAAIDQLLGYVTIHDTKTALILFVPNKDFSAVRDQIVGLVEKHGAYAEHDAAYNPGNAFRFVLKKPDDSKITLQMTVMLFHVPNDA
jgi:hypothetical protein